MSEMTAQEKANELNLIVDRHFGGRLDVTLDELATFVVTTGNGLVSDYLLQTAKVYYEARDSFARMTYIELSVAT